MICVRTNAERTGFFAITEERYQCIANQVFNPGLENIARCVTRAPVSLL
jgi:hypothetical protein